MKNLFFYFLIFLFSYTSSSQETQFNNTYLSEIWPVGYNVFAADTGYYLVGAETQIETGVTVWKFDTLGAELWKKYYGDGIFSNNMGLDNTCKKTPNGYIICGNSSIFGADFQTSVMFYTFNSQFDTIWTSKYLTDTIELSPKGTTYCSDGGFAIAGWTKRDAETGEVLPQTKALLLRIDSQGNYLWHKTYGTTNYADKFSKIVQTPDGGFLCGGSSKSYSNSHNFDWYIVKIDANGNEEWHRRYGSQSYNDSRVCGLFMTSDTSYVISGSFANNSGDQNPSIIVLNQNFQLTQIKSYPYTSSSSYIGQIKEVENGFVGIGGDRINNAEVKQTNLRKFDLDFNEVWRRKYTVGDTTSTDNYILSLDTCSDGGYVMGGWAGGFTGGQRLALIKTDSMGCDGTDWWPCATDIMINEYVHSESFKLYPNPASESFTLNIPVQTGIHSQTIEIFDLTGKLVKQIVRLSGDEASRGTAFSVDISDLEKGLYIVKVGQQTKKLIVK